MSCVCLLERCQVVDKTLVRFILVQFLKQMQCFQGKKHRIHRWRSINLQDVLKNGQHFAARMKRLLAKRHALQDELLETWLGTLKWFCMSRLHIIYIKWILYVFEIYVHTTVTIPLLPLCFGNQGYPACTSRFRAGIIPNLIDTTRLRLPHCSGSVVAETENSFALACLVGTT